MSAMAGGERSLRICLLSTFYPPWNFGGDGIQVQRLAEALAVRGHRVTVVCAPGAHRLLDRRGERAPVDHPDIEVVRLPDGVLSLTAAYLSGRPVRSGRRLRELMDGGFDVLHFNNPSLLGAPALMRMGTGIKLYTAHEQWLLCPSHVLLRRDGSVCRNPPCWGCEISHLRPPQPWRRTSMLMRAVAELDALILPSRASAGLHRRFAPVVRTEVINHFVPDPGEASGDSPLAPGRPFFLYSGRLEPIKGVETLIEAFRTRRSEDLVIAGEGGLLGALRRSAADLPHVHFVGQLDGRELNRLYRAAIAVVMPTIGHEGLPLVALEAFAAGTPAVVRRFGALEEVIADTGAGLSYSSPGELDAALERLADEPGLRDELGRRGRVAFERRFSVDAHLQRYLSLIAELAGEGRVGVAPRPPRERAPSP